MLFASSKKSKGSNGVAKKSNKSSLFVLTDVSSSMVPVCRPIITPKRLAAARTTPVQTQKPKQSSSAPAAAGRSPKSKRVGILSRRRVASSSFTRVDPPSFAPSNGLPFSIDAALSGTVPSYTHQPLQQSEITNLNECTPRGWMFKIHEDTKEELAENLLEHSACTLDISDDEESRAAKNDRGKENIPPPDYQPAYVAPATTMRPVSRKDMMTDEPRTPLGDLDVKEYYAEGCDASSYIIIPAEISNNNTRVTSGVNNRATTSEACQIDNFGQAAVDTSALSEDEWKELLAQMEKSQETYIPAPFDALLNHDVATDKAEIWESQSAKGEDDGANFEAATASLETSSRVLI